MKKSSDFKTFAWSIPVIQICTRLDHLTAKQALPTTAERPKPGRKKNHARADQLELVTDSGQSISIRRPAGLLPKVIVRENRFFLGSGVGAAYRECRGYQSPITRGNQSPNRLEARVGSKTGKVLELLQRPNGASLNKLMAVTGWQAHSVRGFISGTLRRRMGLVVESTTGKNGERIYSIKI